MKNLPTYEEFLNESTEWVESLGVFVGKVYINPSKRSKFIVKNVDGKSAKISFWTYDPKSNIKKNEETKSWAVNHVTKNILKKYKREQ